MTETTYTEADLDAATAAYIETMLWGSCPMSEDGDCDRSCADLNYTSEDDCTDALVASCRADVEDFLNYIDADGLLAICEAEGKSYEGLGQNFWLTRNGHGAGFWDGAYQVPVEWEDERTGKTVTGDLGAELTEAAKSFGTGHCDLYLVGGLVTE